MKIFLASTPSFLMNLSLRGREVKTWVYFGNHHKTLNKLNNQFKNKATSLDYAKKLYALSEQKRTCFIQWIDAMSLTGQIKKEWLFSVPAIKNTYFSNLFLYLCYFFVLEDFILSKQNVDLIFVDSPALALILKKNFQNQVALSRTFKFCIIITYIKILVKSLLRFLKYFLDFTKRYLTSRWILQSRAKQILKDKENIILIRNFITKDFTDNENDLFIKHFFPGLDSFLLNHQFTPVYLPIVVFSHTYWKVFLKIKQSKKTIILPEEFLTFPDYLDTFLTPLRALWHRVRAPLFERIDFNLLVKEEYYSNLTEFGLLYAVLLSRVGSRFKEANIKPLGIINWTENQAIEKGLISGLKEMFPQMQLLGSQPFVIPPNHLSLILSGQERLLGLVPDKLLVLGPVAKEVMMGYMKNLFIDYCPAFRYQNAFQIEDNHRANNLMILLGYSLSNALYILRTLIQLKESFPAFDQVFVKLHPAGYFSQEKLLRELGLPLPKDYCFVDGQLEQYMNQISIGICGATGTAVELVIRGIPVIIVGETHALTLNYLSHKEDQDLWQLCFSAEEIVEAINRFRAMIQSHPKELKEKAREFRRAYFAEPNQRYWENYLIHTN